MHVLCAHCNASGHTHTVAGGRKHANNLFCGLQFGYFSCISFFRYSSYYFHHAIVLLFSSRYASCVHIFSAILSSIPFSTSIFLNLLYWRKGINDDYILFISISSFWITVVVNIGTPICKLYAQWFTFKIGSIIMYLLFSVRANSLKIIALEYPLLCWSVKWSQQHSSLFVIRWLYQSQHLKDYNHIIFHSTLLSM